MPGGSGKCRAHRAYQPGQSLTLERDRPAQVGHLGPAGIAEGDALPPALHIVAGDAVKVDMRVHHHQHKVIQLRVADEIRSEEHTSEIQSLMRISYAVFCLNKQTTKKKFE